MATLLTIKRIAELTNTGKRAIYSRASEESWLFTEKTGRGGKQRIYSVNDLPQDIQEKIHKSISTEKAEAKRLALARATSKAEIDARVTTASKTQALVEFNQLPQLVQDRAHALLKILQAANLRQQLSGQPKKVAWNDFVDAFNNGTSGIDSAVYEVRSSISYKTLQRWQKAFNREGIAGLVEKYGRNKGKGIIDSTPALKEFCEALLVKIPHIKGEQLHGMLEASFEGEYTIPSPSTCRDWLRNWKDQNRALFASLHDPSGWQNKYMSAFGDMSAEVLGINHIWEFDSTPADVMLQEGRYSIVGVIDVFTRRVKLILKPTSNAEAIALLVRKAILDWGVPQIAKTDNGADYLSTHIVTSWEALGVENRITNPYSGWEKPFIERFFRHFSHGITELLDGYIGHSVADREKINARLTFAKRLMERREKGADRVGIDVQLSAKEFQKIIDQWVEFHYHHKKHSELGCTPFEKFTQHKQSIKRLDNERALDILLAPVPGKGFRKVGKEGIKVENAMYIHADLGPHIGETVTCRWNPNDVGKIYVFHHLQGHFICEAIDPEIADQGIAQKHAQEAKRAQRKELAAQRKALKQSAKNVDLSNPAQRFLDHKQSKNGSMTSFPKPSENATNSAIESAIAASTAKTEQYSEAQKATFAERRKQIEELKKIEEEFSKPTFTSEFQKAKWLTETSAKAQIDPIDKAWLHDYRRKHKSSAEVLDAVYQNAKRNQK